MLQKIVKFIGGDPHKREVQKLSEIVDEINDLETELEKLSDDALRAKTGEFRERLTNGETLNDILPEAFAVVREAGKRTIGLRHYDVQMIGGMTLNSSKIAEMRTGEGKTLVATLPLYLNALTGKGVHLVTVNDYLARRDARWMGPIYRMLGLTVGVLQMAARTENGRNAFLVDPERKSPHEDQDQLRIVLRRQAYEADITYGTNSEFGFDYLRDNLAMSLEERVQRGHYYAIVDEVDNILIDEARTPLIISGPAEDESEWYIRMSQVARQLVPEDYEILEKERTVSLTEIGEAHVEQLLNITMRDPERPEDITNEQARLVGYLEQALRAQFLFRRNKDYLVQAGKVVIVDEFTGRLMPGRRWSDGLHQAVEAKEGVKVEAENVTYATITLQNYFRMYSKLGGMTGTALTESEEFYKIYKLDVLPIPTNLEYQAFRQDSALVEVDKKDEQGYRYTYYARRSDTGRTPVFWRRKDYPDMVYRSEEAKLRAITQEILFYHVRGRPQLVGTTSVEHSERLSERLRAEPLRRLLQVMLLRQAWLEKNNREQDERAIPELNPLYKPVGDLNPPDLRQMGRSVGLTSINPEDESNVQRVLKLLNLESEDRERLSSVLQAGIPHQVLNARKHDEESQIIARAGAFGAVTIATNMAGRGVDIKLGGELPEETLAGVNRVLSRAGAPDPYDMTMEQRLEALRRMPESDYGIYETEARTFLQYFNDMKRVRELGGLHVIGSERHEARRIDNQLRGRAARQGDPGSSRFYLSLQDELMRLFGGNQVEGLMQRLNLDEAVPIESGLVGRLVEQAQSRVEGSNFDVRKHLLEYDDVLNSQRVRIYSQRDKVFAKVDLRDDVTEMLRTELQARISKELKDDEEGPWKLLAYLEEIQPPFETPEVSYPSYSFSLILNELHGAGTAVELHSRLLALADKALKAENEHVLRWVRTVLEKSEETFEEQLRERYDTLDAFLEGSEDEPEEGTAPRRPQDVMEELAVLVRTPLRLSTEQMRQIMNNRKALGEDVRAQIQASLVTSTVSRLAGMFERRLEESLGLKPAQYQNNSWSEINAVFFNTIEDVLQGREDRLLGEQGQIARDLEAEKDRIANALDNEAEQTHLLGVMSQGSRLSFDNRTHRRSMQMTTRLRYFFLAARLLAVQTPEWIRDDVLAHMQDAQEKMMEVWGYFEWNRLDTTSLVVSALDADLRASLAGELGDEYIQSALATSLTDLPAEDQRVIRKFLGQRVQNQIYRHLLLSVISNLWVDYLTRVEALRVSIGLEAYAQRDPLVQYKGRASEMFGELLADIRRGVISGMYTLRPRAPESQAPAAEEASGESRSAAGRPQPAPASAQSPAAAKAVPAVNAGGSKKKRHRH